MKKNKIIEYNIDVKFGSKFQREVSLQALEQMLKAWMIFYNSINKRNRVYLTVKEDGKASLYDLDGGKTLFERRKLTQFDPDGVARVIIEEIEDKF